MVLKQRPQDLVFLCLSALFLQPFLSLGEKTYLSQFLIQQKRQFLCLGHLPGVDKIQPEGQVSSRACYWKASVVDWLFVSP